MIRNLPTILNQAVDIGTFRFTNGAASLWISVTVPSNAFSVSKEYLLPIQYNQTRSGWTIANPISDTGSYAGNDFDLDVKVGNNFTSFRLRRTAGSTPGTAYIVIKQEGVNTDIFIPSSATNFVSSPIKFFNNLRTGFKGYYIKSSEGVIREGARMCCNTGDILIEGHWTSFVGEKNAWYKREGNNCLEFYEGEVRGQSGTAEIFCAIP